MTKNIEEKIVFTLMDTEKEGPILTLGIPKGAWEYMKDGKTHHFDLTAAGFPIKLMLFGGDTHDSIIKTIQTGASQLGVTIIDDRNKSHPIKSMDGE